MQSSGDTDKNTLPEETDDHPDGGLPRQLRTPADDDAPLSYAEAEVAGMVTPVYGEVENADDQRDAHRG